MRKEDYGGATIDAVVFSKEELEEAGLGWGAIFDALRGKGLRARVVAWPWW